MKNTKNFLSASVALATLLFISGNILAMDQPTKDQIMDARINSILDKVGRSTLKIRALEALLVDKGLISQDEVKQIDKALDKLKKMINK